MASAFTGVENEAELPLGLFLRNGARGLDDRGEQVFIGGEFHDVGVVLLGHGEHVHGSFGFEVLEAHDVGVLVDLGRRDLASNDLAEDTVRIGGGHRLLLGCMRALAPPV